MCKKLMLISFVLLLAFSGSASAWFEWTGDETDSNSWMDPNNWYSTIDCLDANVLPHFDPEMGQGVQINSDLPIGDQPVMYSGAFSHTQGIPDEGCDAVGYPNFYITGGATNQLTVLSGATLQAENLMILGDWEASANGRLIMEGGDVSVDGLWIGYRNESGVAELYMNGGTLTIVEYLEPVDRQTEPFEIGRGDDASGTLHGSGFVHLNGGVIDAPFTTWGLMVLGDPPAYTQFNPGADAYMNVTGGTLINNGDVRFGAYSLQTAIDLDWLTAHGVGTIGVDMVSHERAYFNMDYNVRNADHTTLTAYMPADGEATHPSPVNYATDQETDVGLSWGPGKPAYAPNGGHDIFFGTDAAAVASATPGSDPCNVYQVRQDANNWDPNVDGGLKIGLSVVYYWRVDEVNDLDATTWPGPVLQYATGAGITSDPSPGDGTTVDIPLGGAFSVDLSWTPGKSAADSNGNDVYFGTDEAAVTDANATYDPCGVRLGLQTETTIETVAVNLDTTYYWKVNSVETGGFVWEGDVWSFTIPNYILLDNFDDYPSDPCLLAVWIDNSVARPEDPFGSGSEIHVLGNAMEYIYDNNGTPGGEDYYSHIWQVLGDADLTQTDGVVTSATISVSFTGDADNDADSVYDRMFIELIDTSNVNAVVYNPDASAAQQESGTFEVALGDFSGVDLNHVKEIYIGFGKNHNPAGGTKGGTGSVIFDDFRLYIPRCRGIPKELYPADFDGDCTVDNFDVDYFVGTWLDVDLLSGPPVDPGTTGLVAHWTFEGDYTNSGSLGSAADGTAVGDVNTVYDAVRDSNVLYIPYDPCTDANYFDYLMVGNTWGDFNHMSFTLAAWAKIPVRCDWWNGDWDNWEFIIGRGYNEDWKMQRLLALPQSHFATQSIGNEGGWSTIWIECPWEEPPPPPPPTCDPGWHQITCVFELDTSDTVGGTLKTYEDGRLSLETETDGPYIATDTNTLIGACQNGTWGEINGDGNAGLLRDNLGRGGPRWLDDIRVYDRALSQEEVLYLAGWTEPIYYPLGDTDIGPVDPKGQREINFADYVVLADDYMKADLWPPGL